MVNVLWIVEVSYRHESGCHAVAFYEREQTIPFNPIGLRWVELGYPKLPEDFEDPCTHHEVREDGITWDIPNGRFEIRLCETSNDLWERRADADTYYTACGFRRAE